MGLSQVELAEGSGLSLSDLRSQRLKPDTGGLHRSNAGEPALQRLPVHLPPDDRKPVAFQHAPISC